MNTPMRLNINLASQPYEDAQVFWRKWGLGLAVAGGITLAVFGLALHGALQAASARQQKNIYQGEIAREEEERSQAEAYLARAENRDVRDRAAYINDLVQRKSLSWTQVLTDLEKIMPPQIHVVSIQPDTRAKTTGPAGAVTIHVKVAGQSRDRALELVRRMEQSQHFHDTLVSSEQAQENPNNPDDRLEFEISALYVPPSAQEGR